MGAHFTELDGDQARATTDAWQRYAALLEARRRLAGYRGSMVWIRRGDAEYLVRAAYDDASGLRRQKSLGLRDVETEWLKAEFDSGRTEAGERVRSLEEGMARLAGVVAALALGRMPQIAARVIRALDEAGLLGRKIRIVGTNALFAYEAAAAVHFDAGRTTSEDVDYLFPARAGLRFTVHDDLRTVALMKVLKKVDRSFDRARATFRAVNKDGFYVDLIKPEPRPPWRREAETVGPEVDDLIASGIEGLFWLQNAPSLEAVAFDVGGAPVRLVAVDPRAFAIHKLWLSRRVRRDPVKRRRDEPQARAVAELVATRLLHLPFDAGDLKMMPIELVEAAAPLFAGHAVPKIEW